MKLSYQEFSSVFEWEPTEIPVLSIENKLLFRQFLSELHDFTNQSSLEFFDNANNLIENIHLVNSPLNLDFNTTQTNKYLSKVLEESIIEDYEKKLEIENSLRELIYDKLSDLSIQVEISDEINLKQLFKLFSIYVVDDSETDIEKLINYIELVETVIIPGMYVFINLKSYFDLNDLEGLYDYCLANEIAILLIENKSDRNSREKLFVIDEDSCEIY